jgi:hypothetical protein
MQNNTNNFHKPQYIGTSETLFSGDHCFYDDLCDDWSEFEVIVDNSTLVFALQGVKVLIVRDVYDVFVLYYYEDDDLYYIYKVIP